MVDRKLTGSAGEHWVCSVLARLGWAPALTRDGLTRTDVLAVDTRSSDRRMIEVQVKTATGTSERTSWPLGLKSQLLAESPREWFIFVALPATEHDAPRSFVVPRNHVSAATWIQHKQWETEPGVPEGRRNATLDQARVNIGVWEGYEDRWDFLRHDAYSAPVLLPPQFRELAMESRIGLPIGHPWEQQLPDW